MSKDNDLINVNLTEAYLRTPARLLGYNGFQHSKGHNAKGRGFQHPQRPYT